MRHLLLVGGGHAHVEVLRRWGQGPLPGWHLTLLTREEASPYSGMLPGVVAGLYRPGQALIDMPSLAARCGATLVLDRATGLDLDSRRAHRAQGADLPWDLLSIDTGARPDTGRVPGAAEHALPLKPIDALLPRLQALFVDPRPGRRLAVVGAGAAGTEIALALARRLPAASVTLAAGKAGLLPGMPDRLRRRLASALAERGVALRQGADASRVAAGALHFADGATMPCDAVIWATGAAAPAWLADTGLARDAQGFLRIGPDLRAMGRDDIFVAGDAAHFGAEGLPKAGVFAVRQGPVLAANLRAVAEGRPPRAFRPQRNWLVLLSLGDGHAVGTRNGLVFGGRWVWWLKDRIDRRFVARYQEKPA